MKEYTHTHTHTHRHPPTPITLFLLYLIALAFPGLEQRLLDADGLLGHSRLGEPAVLLLVILLVILLVELLVILWAAPSCSPWLIVLSCSC
jgi:hypothetical protein